MSDPSNKTEGDQPIAGHYCGQTQSHEAHIWQTSVPFGSTSMAMPRQCAGATGDVAPGSCWHDSGVPWFRENPARTIRCELLAGHAGAHEATRPVGGTAVWPSEERATMPEPRTENDVLTDEVRDLLRDWWDEDTTSGVESAFPIIHRVIRERMARAWDEGVGIGSGHAFPDDPCWQWSEEKHAYLADLSNPYRSSDNPSLPGASS